MSLIIILTLIENSHLLNRWRFIHSIMGLQVHLDILIACKLHETFYNNKY